MTPLVPPEYVLGMNCKDLPSLVSQHSITTTMIQHLSCSSKVGHDMKKKFVTSHPSISSFLSLFISLSRHR